MRTTCPCCGYRTLAEGWGAAELCAVCWWEDDAVQLANPLLRGGANAVSLVEGQMYFITAGVSDPRFATHVRAPEEGEADPDWRPLDNGRDLQGDLHGDALTSGAPYWLKA